MNSQLQDQIIAQIARKMAREIDKSIMKSLTEESNYALVFDQGTVYGKRYYTVGPIWEPTVYGDNLVWSEMMQWCVDTFGKSESAIWGEPKIPDPMERWYVNNSKFWFRDQKDRDWFTLRWSR